MSEEKCKHKWRVLTEHNTMRGSSERSQYGLYKKSVLICCDGCGAERIREL